jgi:hypothetical protein
MFAAELELIPTLRFFAYYQVIENSYNYYSQRVAHQIVERMIKDPLLLGGSQQKISLLLNALRPHLGLRTFGTEKDALMSVLECCLTEQELFDFFGKEQQERLNYFKDSKNSISKRLIVVHKGERESCSGQELFRQVRDRIYDVRCRIVHSKAEDGDNVEPLFPFSKETRQMSEDIELVKFVARQVLINGSKPIQFSAVVAPQLSKSTP